MNIWDTLGAALGEQNGIWDIELFLSLTQSTVVFDGSQAGVLRA